MNFFDQWQEVPDTETYENGFKIQWEHFIRHVVDDEPYKWTLPEGAKGVQLVEAALAELEGASLGRRPGAGDLIMASSSLSLKLPDASGALTSYSVRGNALAQPPAGVRFNRIAYAAAHVVADPARRRRPVARLRRSTGTRPSPIAIICGGLASDRRGDGHGAARHGARLADDALELIRRSLEAARTCRAPISRRGCGTDHLAAEPDAARRRDRAPTKSRWRPSKGLAAG